MTSIIQPRLRRKRIDKTPLRIIDKILRTKYGVSLEYACQSTNKKDIVKYRQVIQTLLCRKTKMTLSAIAFHVGMVDHSSVSHSKQVIQKTESLNRDFGIKEELFKLYTEIENEYIKHMNL